MMNADPITDKTLFVLGAGVDVPLGFPTMNNLLGELARFSVEEGGEVNKAIRKLVKGMQFNISKRAGEQGEQFGELLLSDKHHLIPHIQSALGKYAQQDSSKVKAMQTVVERLEKIREDNFLDKETCLALSDLAGENSVEMDGDWLFKTRGLTLSNAPRQAMRKIFQGALSDIQGLTNEESEALREIVRVVSNFEEMLGEFFSGFFTKHVPNQKRYFYLAWLFWSYLHLKQIEAKESNKPSFYDTLWELGNHNIITFNYTRFYKTDDCSSIYHFHGDCRGFIRFDTREYIRDDDRIENAQTPEDLVGFFESISDQVDWSSQAQRLLLPAIVPPLAVKPIICNEYLDLWAEAARTLERADQIVVIGYSFNVADEHFNDLLRKRNTGAPILLINPHIEKVKPAISQVLNINQNGFTKNQKYGMNISKNGRLSLIESKAEEMTADKLRAVI